jgi:hypothetical protein
MKTERTQDWLCYYSTQKVSWERKFPNDHPPRPGFFLCAPDAAYSFATSSPSTAGTDAFCAALHSYGAEGILDHKAQFEANPPAQRVPTNGPQGVAVCANTVRQDNMDMAYLSAAFIDHHSRLGLDGVLFYDAKGAAQHLLPEVQRRNALYNVAYFNYTAWELLGRTVPKGNPRLSGGRSTAIRAGDQNKALTHTLCRFEFHQLFKNILVADFDEFVFCHDSKRPLSSLSGAGGEMIYPSLTSQGMLGPLRNFVQASLDKGLETTVWPRALVRNTSFIPECLIRAHALGQPLFGCYESLQQRTHQRAPRTQKAMHHGMPCIFTDNHVSCNSRQYWDNGCDCRSGSGGGSKEGGQCELLHLNYRKMPRTKGKGGGSGTGAGPSAGAGEPAIFYTLIPPHAHQYSQRAAVVAKGLADDVERAVFTSLYWASDWKLVKGLFAALRLPVRKMLATRGKHSTKGKYTEFSTKLLTCAYALQFQLSSIVLLEDDSFWPKDLQTRLAALSATSAKMEARNASAAVVAKLSKWGEGYFFTTRGCTALVRKVYQVGMSAHSDVFIRDYLAPLIWRPKIPYHTAFSPNAGNIYYSTPALISRQGGFIYAKYYSESLGDPSPLLQLVGKGHNASDHFRLFRDRGDRNLSEVVRRLIHHRGLSYILNIS